MPHSERLGKRLSLEVALEPYAGADAGNRFAHPTNACVQKTHPDYKQLEVFLQRKEITVTKPALAFFLEKVGSSQKKVDGGKTRIDIDKFTKAFETVVTPPLQI